jgi:hypothetical protein
VQKKLWKLALISTFVIPQTRSWAVSPSVDPVQKSQVPNAQKAASSYILSSKVFQELMNDQSLNELNLRAQQRRLKTNVDYDMQKYFDGDVSTRSVMPTFLKQLNSDILSETTLNELKMTEVTAKSDPVLFHEFIQVLRTFGQSEQQIKNAKCYRSMGPINAYAYTISPDHVYFVVYDSLDNIASRAELRGVMGHEIGHVRAGHVKYGALDTSRQLFLINHLLAKANSNMAEDEKQRVFAEIKVKLISERAKTFVKQASDQNEAVSSDARRSFSNLIETATLPKNYFSQDEESAILSDYVDRIIANLSVLEIPERYREIFENVKQRLQANDPIAVNMDQLQEALHVWTLAYSRADETSADYWGDLVGRPSRVAMMDAKFGGRKISADPTRKEIQDAVKSVILQVQKAQRMNTRQGFYELVGGPNSGDHPFSNMRILRQAKFDQSIDRISLANPFLRIAVLLDEARSELADIDQNILITQKQALEYKSRGFTKLAGQAQAQIKKQVLKRIEAQENIKKIESELLRLLADPAFDKTHPRSTDLLDYRLAQKQMIEAMRASLQSSGQVNDSTVKATIDVLSKAIQEFGQDPVLRAAITVLETQASGTGEQKALEAAKRALSEQSIPNDTLEARKALAELTKSGSRISLTVDLSQKSSNVSLDRQGTFKDEAQAARMISAGMSKVKLTGLSCKDLFN